MIRLVQAVLRGLFMRVESFFNSAFGDRLNPLYHLGAISFSLFWVIAASGIYLYAFFETSVVEAHASVEALTHRQWLVGGILRSLHRYASDAMVLTMLLHMLRYFAFDRFRGFRWFSWLTGVALIWLVYLSGINGYMLPWDQLAQFVIVSVFEWLDALPMFGGTLMRNFIYPSSINDRFFSLLAFMHIGISLIVLLLMWIHVQRVPKAETTPPRAILISLMLALLGLAAVQPALSQGGAANLGIAVSRLNLDWFYLAILPILNHGPLLAIWVAALCASAVLMALPWLAPPKGRAPQGEFQMTIVGSPVPITVKAGDTLLDAGLRQGAELPYECRNGGCGRCLCTVIHGDVDHGRYQPHALPDGLRAQGKTLMCCATALSDLEIELDHLGQAAAQKIAQHVARVDQIERLTPDLIRLQLVLPEGETLNFVAGQYINIVLPDGQRRAFSFANPPHRKGHIELHVRWIPNGLFTTHVFTTLAVGDSIRFEGPLGNFKMSESTAPILFVAGATGFAPVKSIVEDAFHRNLQREMWLYWGVRRRQDLYLLQLAQSWQQQHPNFHVVPVLSEPVAGDGWTGRTGLVHQAILQDFHDLSGHELYVCGSVKMVDSAVPEFIAQGASADACFSDAFVTAPPTRNSPTV